MGISAGPDMIQNGLVLALDAADRNSYISGSTTWTDLSGNNNNGTLINGPTFSSANQGSIVFDGVNDYVATNFTQSLGTSLITFEAWIKYNVSQVGAIISKRMGLAYNYEQVNIFVAGNANGGVSGTRISWFHSDGVFTRSSVSPNSYGDNIWHHVVLSCNTSADILYIDGTFITSVSTTKPNLIQSPPLYVGTSYDDVSMYVSFFNGSIANAKYYNRALSAQEVLQNYNATKTRFGL